jgi:hypothetical protein
MFAIEQNGEEAAMVAAPPDGTRRSLRQVPVVALEGTAAI